MAREVEIVQHCPAEPLEKSVCGDGPVEARMARLLILGLVCPNCGVRVRNALLRVPGVVSADVDWERGLAFVDFVPTATDAHALIRAITGAGTDAEHNFQAALIP